MENRLIPNSTQIPNVISDLIMPRVAEGEMRCLQYICRRTYGFQKERDRISFSQFVNGIKDRDGKQLDYGTGLSRPSIAEALRNLLGANLIKTIPTPKGNYYEINLELFKEKDANSVADEVVKKVNQLRKLTKSGKESKPKQVKLVNLQNKGNKEKQSIGEQSSPIHILRTYFTEQCKEKKEFEPVMNFGKEGKLLKERLKMFSIEQLKDLIDKFLNSRIGEDLGYTLGVCLSAHTINLWQAGKLEKEKRPYYRGDPIISKNGKQYVICNGEFLEFCGKESEIIWK